MLVSNRHWVLQSKVVVLSANGKGHRNGQVSAVKLNESEEPTKRRMDEGKSFEISKHRVLEAYKRVKANRGAAGIDEISLVEFE